MAVKKRALDFTNVKDGGEFSQPHQTPGDYAMKITGVSEGSSEKGNDYWTFTCQDVLKPRATYPYRCTLNEASLWKLRNLFVACGIPVPKKKVQVDPGKLVGKKFGAALEDEEYKDRLRSVIAAVFPVSDVVPTENDSKPTDDEEVEDVEEEVEEELDMDDL